VTGKSLDEFLNPERRRQNREIQLRIRAESPGMKRRIRRRRSQAELSLLAQTISDRIKQWDEEGITERHGRHWKLHL
jgi:hypothetical protein